MGQNKMERIDLVISIMQTDNVRTLHLGPTCVLYIPLSQMFSGRYGNSFVYCDSGNLILVISGLMNHVYKAI